MPNKVGRWHSVVLDSSQRVIPAVPLTGTAEPPPLVSASPAAEPSSGRPFLLVASPSSFSVIPVRRKALLSVAPSAETLRHFSLCRRKCYPSESPPPPGGVGCLPKGTARYTALSVLWKPQHGSSRLALGRWFPIFFGSTIEILLIFRAPYNFTPIIIGGGTGGHSLVLL